MTTLEVRQLKAFSTQIRTAARRDLDLLKVIEDTLDALDIRCTVIRQMNLGADQFIKKFSETHVSLPGEDVDVAHLFEKARDAVAAAYERCSVKHLCAVSAPELDEDDGVVEAYALLLTETAALHEKLNTLAWLIREQEADQDIALPGVYSNADDLFEAMGV